MDKQETKDFNCKYYKDMFIEFENFEGLIINTLEIVMAAAVKPLLSLHH